MGTKTGELREMLVEAMAAVRDGKLTCADATAMAKLAAQVSLSMQTEINVRQAFLDSKGGINSLGDALVGELAEEQPRLGDASKNG